MQNQIGGAIPQVLPDGISSPVVNPQAAPNMGYIDPFYQMEQEIGAQVREVLNLVARGRLTQDQGRSMLTQLADRAQQINMYKSAQVQPEDQPVNVPQQPQVMPVQTPMDMFNQEHPGFFETEGRGDVLNYLKNCELDKDEILQIAKLVEGLENSAVEKYLKKSKYDKSLNDENKLAKSKLTAYAQNGGSDSNLGRIFTREDIGRMSGDEFNKNEKLIMNQLKQGLIR